MKEVMWPGGRFSLGETDRVRRGGLSVPELESSCRTRMDGSRSAGRGVPEWPLIMPCDARNVLILSRSSATLLFS